ncbi:MAG: Signal transduction histidine kinase containing PAS domain [Candidatus Methanohalarchaeum thermophilum]|uniref:histidine kinase n=1 Tax=Methanohalarchaeum thermophilum TaxID=1903181 RepID=A0A1Q6DSZ4_METT1|nr:MAG: Signal transduction histidine kinase containing PAS domain [Candidatus Methanohalarchaeum thermophilum]
MNRRDNEELYSRSFFNAILDEQNDNLAVLDGSGDIVSVNKSWMDFGDSEGLEWSDYGVGKNYLDICYSARGKDSDLAKKAGKGIEAVLEGDQDNFRMEYPCHSPEKERWFLVDVSGFRFDGSVYAVVSHRNITERKRSEESLKIYREVVDVADELIGAIDDEYRYIFTNQAYKDTFVSDGVEGLRGVQVKDVLGDKAFNKLKPYFDRCLDGEKVKYTKEIDVGKNEVVYLEISDYPLRDSEGDVVGLAGVAKDVTEQKKIKKRERFLHSLLRHDVKNKNQIVKGYLELLKESDLPEEEKEKINKALDACNKSNDIIKKVRTLSKISEEEIKSVKIEKTIQEVVDENRARAQKRDMEFVVEQDCPSSDCLVEGGALLKELFNNLIENSIKHSNGNKIKITSRSKGNQVICTVEDDGEGIPQEIKNKIFEKGFKHGETSETGLGLYLVREIAESYGGKVKAKNSDMGGAKFELQLKKHKPNNSTTPP